MGVCGAGKTTVGTLLAAQFGGTFIDADSLHPPANQEKMRSGTPLTDADRRTWLDAVAIRLAEADDAGDGVVVACSALKRAYRDHLRAAAPGLRLVHLSGPDATIHRRLEARSGHFMPAGMLESQLATLEPPAADERPIVIDIAPPPDEIAASIARALNAAAGP